MPGIAKMVSNFGGPDFNLAEQRRLIANLLHEDAHGHITDALVEERFAVARTQPKDVIVRMRTPDLSPRLGEIAQPIFVLWGLNDDFCPESHARLFLEKIETQLGSVSLGFPYRIVVKFEVEHRPRTKPFAGPFRKRIVHPAR